MTVEIISPSAKLYSGEVKSVTVPSQMGPFTLLENHAPIVAILEEGKVSLTDTKGEASVFAIKGGFVEQHDNMLTVCVEP
ncbi:MAG: ATP synthase F1 subunit epsilon [Bacteroidales bacterium]|nr:ATP synthase F1 subunit epsilon [Bacteroidales bacterium]